MKNAYEIIIRPIITEKTSMLIEERKYTFEVAKGANKIDVKRAVEEVFEVDVTKVNIINVRKKAHKVGKYEGMRPAVRKAIVTLAEGQKLDVFEV